MDSDLVKIEKLQKNEQWLLWKFQIKILLKASELWEVVNGSLPTPVQKPAQNAEEFAKVLSSWKKLDTKAQKVIVTTIGQEPMLHIMSCDTAFDMWSTLESVFEQKSKTTVHLLQQRFYSFSKEQDDSISIHISKLQKIVQQLKDLGENISDTMVITKILMTLPAHYNHFYTAWESTAPGDQTLKNLTARLLMEESRIDSQNSIESESNALVAKRYQYKNKKLYVGNRFHGTTADKNKMQNGKCFLCKQKGHYKSNCPQKSKSNGEAFVSQTSSCIDSVESDCWYLDS